MLESNNGAFALDGSRAKRMLVAGLLAVLALGIAAAAPDANAKTKKKPKILTKTFSSGSLALIAPDPNTADAGANPAVVRSPIPVKNIPAKAKIKDVNLQLRITAAADSDVEVAVATPRGVREITSDNGAGLPNYGTGTPDCNGQLTTFDSQATTSVMLGSAPFTGSFLPEEGLNFLNNLKGVNAKQAWTLLVDDDDDTGAVTLNCWKLVIQYQKPLPTKKTKK